MTHDLNAMVVFGAVVKHGSFTAAGRALALPKSTVSRRVAQLEEELGLRLLQRTTRRMSVTEAGRQFYDYCLRVTELSEAAYRQAAGQLETPSGLLRITTDEVFGTVFLPDMLAGFMKDHPALDVNVVLSPRRLDLIEQGFDLAVWAGPLPDSSYIARRLGEDPQLLCASPAYVKRAGTPQTPEELADHDCLVYGIKPTPVAWKLMDATGRLRAFTVAGRLKAGDMTVLLRSALAGLGIARLPGFMAAPELATGRLVNVLPGWHTEPTQAQLVYPSSQGLSPKVRAFADYLVAQLKATPIDSRLLPS